MKYLFILQFSFLSILFLGQETMKSMPIIVNSNVENSLSAFKANNETSVDQLLHIIKFEKGDTIFTAASLLKLNRLISSYPDFGFRIIGLNNKAAYFVERRWKAIRNYLLKSGHNGVCIQILASGSLKSFTYKQRCVNIVIFGD